MPFQPCPGIAQVNVIYSQDGQVVENVFHVQIDTEWTATNIAALCTVVLEEAADDMTNKPTNCALVKVVVRDLTTEFGETSEQVEPTPVVGESTSPALPNHVTVATKFNTGAAGRSFHGRSYYIGLVEADVIGNTVGNGTLTRILSEWDTMATLIATVDDSPQICVLSRIQGGIERENGICTNVLTFTVDPTVDSQRRRLPGRGA